MFGLRAYHQSEPVKAKQWLAADNFRLVTPVAPSRPGIRNASLPAAPGIDGRIRSFSLTFDQPLPWQRVSDALETLAGFCSHRLLRMKAIVNVQEYPGRPVVLHAVQHLFYPSVELPRWPDDNQSSRFVFITADLDETFVSNLLSSFTQTLARPWVVAEYGFYLRTWIPDLNDGLMLAVVAVLALLFSLIPGAIAYRRSLQDGLTVRV